MGDSTASTENDPTRRLMVIIDYNMDIGDTWVVRPAFTR
jgi:hypothetical protein